MHVFRRQLGSNCMDFCSPGMHQELLVVSESTYGILGDHKKSKCEIDHGQHSCTTVELCVRPVDSTTCACHAFRPSDVGLQMKSKVHAFRPSNVGLQMRSQAMPLDLQMSLFLLEFSQSDCSGAFASTAQ